MEDKYIKKIMAAGILVILLVISFLILQPILLSIVLGFILAFVFTPIYDRILKSSKSQNFSATVVCAILILILVLPLWFLTPLILEQSFKIYQEVQKVNFVEILQQIFPSLLGSDQFSSEIGATISSFMSSLINSLVNGLAQVILDFPTISLQFIVVLFTLFFVLRDRVLLIDYLKSVLPFSKEVQAKLFNYSHDITSSVIYGQVILGILQGIIVGAGFLIFGVKNALLLSIISIAAGIFPIVGPMLVWIPVAIFAFISGNLFGAIGISIFGVVGSNVDSVLRPFFVSRRSKIHSAVVLIGMIGGFFLFGILGLILGPLFLAYLIIVLELYRNKKNNSPIVGS